MAFVVGMEGVDRLFWGTKMAYVRLGLGEVVGGDRVFEQMVRARLTEPTSKAYTPRVLSDLLHDA